MGWATLAGCCGGGRDRTNGGAGPGRGGGATATSANYDHCGLEHLPLEILAHERTLATLTARANRIQDLPPQLFLCTELMRVTLADNEIRTLPSALAALKELVHLDCSKNALVSLPDEAKSLKKLRILDLSANPLDKLPEPITSLISLQELYLNDVGLEYLPANFGRLTDLRILELRDNRLALLPKSLARATALTRLDLGRNEFSDLPDVVGEFPELRELWVDGNNLISLPLTVGKLSSLIHLEAEDNFIAVLPDELGKCGSLECVSLGGNRLTKIPNSIGGLSALVTLDLQSNSLSRLPDEIGDLVSLEELTVSKNFLEKLPSAIGRLRKLRCLLIDENKLKELPPEIGGCSSLGVLSLRGNRIERVPEEIGRLSKLKVLNLVGNSLRNLPHTLLNCGELVALWLSENQSKPLVPMQAEIDPHTKRRVLTCILFPQLPPVEYDNGEENRGSIRASPRHISFVDVKTTAKGQERPSQLRRAPTPYPKELRAMAKNVKHANSNKDSADEALLSTTAEVRVRAAKITPTLRQRFVDELGSAENGWTDADGGAVVSSPSPESPLSENPYEEGSVRNSERLYSESNDSAYGGYIDRVDSLQISGNEFASENNYPSFVRNESDIDDFKNIVNQNHVETYAQAKEKIYGNHRSNYQRHSNNGNATIDDLNYVNCNLEKEVRVVPMAGHDRPDAIFRNSGLSPPPYHIAATYSKQAQFFNRNNLRESINE